MNMSPKGGTPLHEAIAACSPLNIITLLLQFGRPSVKLSALNLKNVDARSQPFRRKLREKDPLGACTETARCRFNETPGEICQVRRVFAAEGENTRVYTTCRFLQSDNGDKKNKQDFYRRWVVVIPRSFYVGNAGEKTLISTSICIYEDTNAKTPLVLTRVDNAVSSLDIDAETGYEVSIVPEASESHKIRKNLVFANGEYQLIFVGAEHTLARFLKVLVGHSVDTTSTPKGNIENTSIPYGLV